MTGILNRSRIALAAFTVFLFSAFIFLPALASAETAGQAICSGASAVSGEDCNGKSGTDINHTIKLVINVLSVLVGIVAVIMIIVGGFRYITSGGATDKVAGAKNTLLYAVIGLAIVALAQVIVKFVLHQITQTK